ncbi:hypothetical protein [Sphingomonas sp.]|uniref:hypothetical protein n=1 Tax=Sphingomonas sp. TaxID=28214 RepID=UPI0038AB4BCD
MRVNPLAGARAGAHQIGVAKKDEQRDERLAAALRENLRRRKAQARELSDVAKDPHDQP